MAKSEDTKNIVFRKNPNIDFLFGYFGDLQAPTKQDAFKPIDVIHTD